MTLLDVYSYSKRGSGNKSIDLPVAVVFGVSATNSSCTSASWATTAVPFSSTDFPLFFPDEPTTTTTDCGNLLTILGCDLTLSRINRLQRRRRRAVRDNNRNSFLLDDPGGLEDVGEHVVFHLGLLLCNLLLMLLQVLLLLQLMLLSQVEDDQRRLGGFVGLHSSRGSSDDRRGLGYDDHWFPGLCVVRTELLQVTTCFFKTIVQYVWQPWCG